MGHSPRAILFVGLSHMLSCSCIEQLYIQSNFGGSNTDGSFTTAVSNSFLSP